MLDGTGRIRRIEPTTVADHCRSGSRIVESEWVEFTLADGNPLLVNLNALASVQPCDDQTSLHFIGGRCETIREGYAEVHSALGLSDNPPGD